MDEKFVDVKGYYGRYQVSNTGKVWSVITHRILKPKIDKDGYETVCLTFGDGRQKYERVHRLVAIAFCEKPEGCNIVNHIDLNRRNNLYTNLEWTTVKGNTKHGYDYGNVSKSQQKATEAAKEVNACIITVYKDGVIVGVFKGKNDAAKALGINVKTIYNCVKENRKTRNGYYFTVEKGDTNAAN